MENNPYQTPENPDQSEQVSSGVLQRAFRRYPRLLNWLLSSATILPLYAAVEYMDPSNVGGKIVLHMPFLPSNRVSPEDAIDLYNHYIYLDENHYYLLVVLWFTVPVLLVNLLLFVYRRWANRTKQAN